MAIGKDQRRRVNMIGHVRGDVCGKIAIGIGIEFAKLDFCMRLGGKDHGEGDAGNSSGKTGRDVTLGYADDAAWAKR